MLRNKIAACLLFASFAMGAQAQDAPQTPPNPSPGVERCADHPRPCGSAKERRAAYCKDNPQRCEHFRARREEMRQKCTQDPVACEKQRQEMRQKARQRFEERCKADPERCEAMKKRWQENKEKHPDFRSNTPSTPAPASGTQ